MASSLNPSGGGGGSCGGATGGAGDNPDDPGDPPRTPRLKLREDDLTPLSPDTEDNVAEQTDAVFRNFVFNMYTNERAEQDGPDDTPDMPELTAFPDEPLG